MQISARNMLKGTVRKIKQGSLNAEVTLELSSGEKIVSIITNDSLANLGIQVGLEAFAVIKASNVMLAVEH